MNAAPAPWLLADIGGTHARFALAAPGAAARHYRVLRTRDFAGPRGAIAAYLARIKARGVKPRHALIAVAAPITGDKVALTNSRWSFSTAALARACRLERIEVVNDFEALAWALPGLGGADVAKIGRGRAARGAPMAVLGPGTGLGVACLVPAPRGGGMPVAVASEGGHATLAATTAREAAAIAQLHRRFGHVSAERVLSGPGLVNLYGALAGADGDDGCTVPRPGEIAERARQGSDVRAGETVAMFSAFAGQFAGNVALFYAARGGVYLGGGVLPRLGEAFDRRLFRRNFEAKGRYRAWLGAIPTYLIRHPSPAMIGLARHLAARAGAS